MSWGIVAGAAISAVGGAIASSNAADAAEGAADKSAASARDATQLQGKMYDQTREDQAPWRYGGENALNRLLQGMGIDTKNSYTGQESRDQIYDRLLGEYTRRESTGAPNVNASGEAVTLRHFANLGENATSVDVTDYARLNAAVDAEYAKQQATGNLQQPRGADFGKLAKNFTMADYQADPGYGFRVSEGQKALERSAAARGGLYSGRAAKDLTRFGQDMGSQEYGNAYNRFQSNQTNQFNRLSSLAGVGQVANNALGAAGQNYANNTGNIMMANGANQGNAMLAAGNARASGYAGMGNALGSAVGKINWGGGSSSGYDGGYSQIGGNGGSYSDASSMWN